MGEWPSEQTSPAAKGFEDAWAKFNSSWKQDEDLAELAALLRSGIPAAQSAGLEGEVHNCIHSFIEEIARTHLEHDKCRALAEDLTELSMAVNNKWANAAINTLVFSTYFPRADYGGALPWLERSVAMDNGAESENSLNNSAICYAMLGNTELATAIFLRAVAVGKSEYLPEALFYLVHILAKCNSSVWSHGALTWVAQSLDSQYAAKAMSCLQGNCSSLYKFAFGSKSHKLLSASSENFSEVLVQIHQWHWSRWVSETPLTEANGKLDDYSSPASAWDRIQKTGLEPQLLEFCAQVNRGQWPLHWSILAVTLEGDFEPSFSTFGAELLALWNLGETLLILNGLAQDAFLGQPEYDPKKHPGVNFAIQETLIRTLRTKPGYVSYSEDLVGWEVSLDSALESNYFDALVEQRQEGNLEKFTELLRESSSDPSMSIPHLAKGVGAVALLLLDVLKGWSAVQERIARPGSTPHFSLLLLGLVNSSPDPGDEEAAIQSLHEFLNIRLSFIRGELSQNDEITCSIQDSDFLARCLLMLAANDASTVLDDCLLVLENSLVSPSLLPKVQEIAQIAWANGAKYDPSDDRLSKFPELVSLMLRSKSPSEVFSLSKNPALEKLVQEEDSLPLRLSKGTASKEEMLDFVMSGRAHHAKELATLRGLHYEVYAGLFQRFGREIVHLLAINPDSYEALESEVGDLISSDRELGYACAKSFSEAVEADWPRAMLKRLLETENRKALLLLAQDQRMSDNQLQKIASKANKEIAEALNQNPKASDETRALAQLVAQKVSRMIKDRGMSIEQLSSMLGELGWGAQNMGSYVTCHPGDTLFHGAFFILEVKGIEWVTGQAFPIVGVPDSLELRKFVNNIRLSSGVLLQIQDAGSGLVDIILSAKFPSRNLEPDELNFLFYGIFGDGIEVGEEIIGRFGGIWKDESQEPDLLHESLWLVALQNRVPSLVTELSLEPGAEEVDISNRRFGLEVLADIRQTAITLSREENNSQRMSLVSPVTPLDEATFYSQEFQSAIHNFSDPCISMRLHSSNNETVLVAACNFPLMGYVLDEVDAMVIRFFREKALRVDELSAIMTSPLKHPSPFTFSGDWEWSESMLELLEDFGALRPRRI